MQKEKSGKIGFKHKTPYRSAFLIVLAVSLSIFSACGTGGTGAAGMNSELTHVETLSEDTATEPAATQTAEPAAAQTAEPATPQTTADTATDGAVTDTALEGNSEEQQEEEDMSNPTLLYQGHASLRIVTGEGKVIYIDPFAGEGYDLPADIILQTHGHFDHGDMSKISSQNAGCTVITHKDALVKGDYKCFDFGYVKVEAVEAGYNKNHDKKNCVGYILTFSNGVTLYASGDTSKTEQMPELKERNLDYAFFCCDGVYNMDVKEAVECAELVGAKVSIPYHTGSASVTPYDADNAAKFDAPGALLLKPGEELELK